MPISECVCLLVKVLNDSLGAERIVRFENSSRTERVIHRASRSTTLLISECVCLLVSVQWGVVRRP